VAKDDYWAAEVHVQQLAAHAWIAQAKGEGELASSLMGAAADEEDRSDKSSVSPGRLIPAHELLGDMLLEDGRAAGALTEYEAALQHDPRRFRSISGAARAAAAAGNADKARQYYGVLVEMAGAGDPRPELAAARQYLAR
jgi:Tfp pilus assembly protein PilF